MLLKITPKGKKFFKSEVKGYASFIKNAILLVRNQSRVLFVDYLDDKVNLGGYRVPPFLEGQLYFYEVIDVPEDYVPYLPCIAKAVEDKVIPLYKNRRLSCNKELVVVIENDRSS
ncbi:hypothetical protein [Sulfuracidifex tepidarius]|uniref:hypothetical protein n=1 Tax=Sulfuracidifex tepidarius TaxID=1294262 RepID=UPI0011F0AD32|nr:hypothetical protein [Sulfuracidifex tepidarius]